jgi:hypothetical protein
VAQVVLRVKEEVTAPVEWGLIRLSGAELAWAEEEEVPASFSQCHVASI